ncbi:MAG: flippase [Patescibacteria group bacterium]|jgi:O-antigen/teichoic acid export membrane protein
MEISSNGRIARNTTLLTGAFIFQKVLSFFYFAYISRQLGSDSIGKYVWALSFAGIFALFIEFGLGPVLTREISRDYEKAKDYLSSVLGIKILFSGIVALAIILSAIAMGRDALTMQVIYVAVAIVILDSFTFSFYAIFRAYQKLHFEAIGLTIYQIIIVGAGIAGVVFGLSIRGVVGAVLLGSIFNFTYSLCLIIYKAKLHLRIKWDKKIVGTLLKIAIPFAIAGIFFKVNNEIDKVLLGVMAGDKYVGWYSIASKFNMSLTFIPGAVATSFYPAMSRYFVTSKNDLAHTFEKAMIYLMGVSLPIATGSFVLAERIILKLYGPAFSASIIAFQIIISGLVFVFLNYPIGNFLNACNKQKINSINMGIATAINIILNVILIPKHTYIGASIAAVVSAVVLILLGMPWVGKIAPYNKKLLFTKFIKLLFSSVAMGILLYLLKDDLSILLLMPIGILIYVILIFAIKAVSVKDLKAVLLSVFKKKNAENTTNNN